MSAVFLGSFLLVSCNIPTTTPQPQPVRETQPASASPAPEATLTATPPPARVLTVCLGQEPTSLFLYGDASAATRAVRSAVYDGPLDTPAYQFAPVILQDIPDLNNGGVTIETVQVEPGAVIAAPGNGLSALQEGALVLPPGCRQASCALAYTGSEPAAMEQLVVRFKLLPGLQWSDGQPLTADDSVYSYEVAQALLPRFRPELMRFTASYRALDETTLEWRGIPGYISAIYPTFFFTPLPRHAWGSLPPADLLSAESAARSPLGWGAYIIESWVAGDHISLRKNPGYFRSADGLPHFDRLVFRFVSAGSQALSALVAGECDLLDDTALEGVLSTDLKSMENAGSLELVTGAGTAWEQIVFGINPANPARPAIFKSKAMRQAVALCLDRVAMVQQLFAGDGLVLDGYLSPQHPLVAANARRYSFDPPAAASLMDAAGWLDLDQNPQTPRLSQGVAGIPDGTPLEISYLTISGTLRQQVGQWVQTSLAQCGFIVRLEQHSREEVFAPGPDGQLFGRNFDMAQFAWTTSLEPPCFLFTSAQVPGPYPEFPNGWGGGNAAGYSSPEFDAACGRAQNSLPGTAEYNESHQQAQLLFAEDLPVLPLYIAPRQAAARPDLCGLTLDPSADSMFWNLEALDYGDGCGG